MKQTIKSALFLPLAIMLVSCASTEQSPHLEGFRSSLRNLDRSYAEPGQNTEGATLLNSTAVEGMESGNPEDLNSWRYLAFQSEMYRGMTKGDKPSWYREAAREEVGKMEYAPEDLKKFVIERTNQATREREKRN